MCQTNIVSYSVNKYFLLIWHSGFEKCQVAIH